MSSLQEMKKPTKETKYFIYARKSTDVEDRQIASIESQLDEIKKISNGLNIVGCFTESKSAKKLERPQFEEMLRRIEKGEANGILSWKINRLSRNPVSGGKILWLLQEGIIQHIKTFERNYVPTDNMLPLYVELGMSNQYSLDLSVDVTRGLRQKAQKEEKWRQDPWRRDNDAAARNG